EHGERSSLRCVLIHAEKEDERRDHDEPASNTNHARQNPCPDTGEQANDKNFHGVSTGAVMFSLVFALRTGVMMMPPPTPASAPMMPATKPTPSRRSSPARLISSSRYPLHSFPRRAHSTGRGRSARWEPSSFRKSVHAGGKKVRSSCPPPPRTARSW